MHVWKRVVIGLSAFLYLSSGMAAKAIEGNWVIIDDKTGHRRALAQFAVKEGALNATIADIYPEPGDTGVCSACPGNFKNKPVRGLQFVWGLKENANGEWDGGYILDAKKGKIYRVKMSIKNNKLYVHGYIGVAMLGRTQVWVRA